MFETPALEFCLSPAAHDDNGTRAAYQQYRYERWEMLQAWSDELDRIIRGGSVVELKQRASCRVRYRRSRKAVAYEHHDID